MNRSLTIFVAAIFLAAALGPPLHAQGPTTSLSGVVVDQSGGVIPGATITVKDKATATEYTAITADNGTFSIPALGASTYTVTVVLQGFKTAVLDDVRIHAGQPANVRAVLEVGSISETVIVQDAAQIVQSQSATISTTMAVNQMSRLPLATRNAMDFLVFLPGVNTTGGARGSTINGLPNTTINITIDGINTQDNYNKTGDGFFSYISPRLDAIEEVTVSTATPGAESAGHGAVQIKFVTRSGNNELHGSLYEYHRNPSLNANYWFNNRDRAAVYKPTGAVCTNEQLQNEPDKCKAPRDRVLLNQFGGRVGGPIWIPGLFNGRDRAFFFVNYEEFRLPAQQGRRRTILDPAVEQGIFRYTVSGAVREVNMLTLAAAKGQTPTMDPTVQKLLADIRKSTSGGTINAHSNPSYQYLDFVNSGVGIRKFPTVRFDVNVTPKHRLELSWNYSQYVPSVDMLNSVDPAFPGFPNFGMQGSNRHATSITWRSTLTPRLVNEARVGFVGGTTLFSMGVEQANFTGSLANMDGFSLGISAAGISNAHVSTSPSRRNTPVSSFEDTVTWTKGSHSLSFGFSFTNIGSWTWSQTVVPSITFGVDTTFDPAASMFNTTNGPVNFPGASSSQLTDARNIYGVLTGRVTAIGGSAVLDEKTLKYAYQGQLVRRARQREIGMFVQDSWRVRPGLTLTGGLRWEVQLPWTPLSDVFTFQNPEEVWGPSGWGNIFKPGATGGVPTVYYAMKKGTHGYDIDYKAFAPSLGFAWSPKASDGLLGKLIGGGGQTAIRGGVSVAYNRYGMAEYNSIWGSNPGSTITATRNMSLGNLITGNETLPVLFRDKSRLGPPDFMKEPVYPLIPTVSNSANAFDRGIRTPYTISWSFGIQREITKDIVVEVRYVANRNLQVWYQRNLNEINVVENGFLDEFKLAMANLQANRAAGRGNTFRYSGPNTGTHPLPITLAYFSGVPASQASDSARYTSGNFTSTTYVNQLALHSPGPSSFASSLQGSATQRTNALNAGLPANFFVLNPDVLNGGAWIYSNGGQNWYDSMQVDVRRRMARGLLVQANYTFAKSLNSQQISWRVPRAKQVGSTLPHAFKINWVWDLPFGRGKALFNSFDGILGKLIDGWEFHGTGRMQSGNLINLGNVQLVGMTLQELQQSVGVRFNDATKVAYYYPQDIIDNTIKAFNVSATTTTGYSSAFGVPEGRYIAPAGLNGCIQVVSGDCAPLNTYIRGPRFTRYDLSLVKRIAITEKANFEFRGEFLNAFNFVNFYGTTCTTSAQTCGQVTSAYQDRNQTQDPGGRLIQFVARINF